MRKFQGIFKNYSTFSKILILVGIVLFCTLVTLPFIGILLHLSPAGDEVLKISQLLMSIGMFVIPPFIFAYLCSENTIGFLQLNKKVRISDVLVVVLFMMAVIPFINLLNDLNHRLVLPQALSGIENQMKAMEEAAAKLTEKLLNVHTINGLLFNILVIAIIPALGEELIFRGTLQSIFKDWKGIIVGIWFAAFIFSAIHMQFYGFVPRMLMGAFFGYLVYWSGNIWLPILAHFTNNVLAVIFYYLKFNGVQTIDIDTIGTGNTLWIGIVSGIVVIAGILLIKGILQKPDLKQI